MVFLEVTSLDGGHKSRVNVDHIVRYGAYSEENGKVLGSYIAMSAPVGNSGRHAIQVRETAEEIDHALSGFRVGVARVTP